MNFCPKCQAKLPANQPICPHCGLVFQKWQEHERRISSAASSVSEESERETEPEDIENNDLGYVRGWFGGALPFIGVAFAIDYYRRGLKRKAFQALVAGWWTILFVMVPRIFFNATAEGGSDIGFVFWISMPLITLYGLRKLDWPLNEVRESLNEEQGQKQESRPAEKDISYLESWFVGVVLLAGLVMIPVYLHQGYKRRAFQVFLATSGWWFFFIFGALAFTPDPPQPNDPPNALLLIISAVAGYSILVLPLITRAITGRLSWPAYAYQNQKRAETENNVDKQWSIGAYVRRRAIFVVLAIFVLGYITYVIHKNPGSVTGVFMIGSFVYFAALYYLIAIFSNLKQPLTKQLDNILIFLFCFAFLIVHGRGVGLSEEMAEANMRKVIPVLEQYRQQHGKYPEKLAALSPDYFANVPTCHNSSQPVRYYLADNGSYGLVCMTFVFMRRAYSSETKTWETYD